MAGLKSGASALFLAAGSVWALSSASTAFNNKFTAGAKASFVVSDCVAVTASGLHGGACCAGVVAGRCMACGAQELVPGAALPDLMCAGETRSACRG